MRLIVVDFACVLCYPKTWKTQMEDPGPGFDPGSVANPLELIRFLEL